MDPRMTDVLQLFGRQICQCPASCDGPPPSREGSNHHCCAFQARPKQAFGHAAGGASFRVSHCFGLPFRVCGWERATQAFSGCSAVREQLGEVRQSAVKSVLNRSTEMVFCRCDRSLERICAHPVAWWPGGYFPGAPACPVRHTQDFASFCCSGSRRPPRPSSRAAFRNFLARAKQRAGPQ